MPIREILNRSRGLIVRCVVLNTVVLMAPANLLPVSFKERLPVLLACCNSFATLHVFPQSEDG